MYILCGGAADTNPAGPTSILEMLTRGESDRIPGLTVFGVEASELRATVHRAMLQVLRFDAG